MTTTKKSISPDVASFIVDALAEEHQKTCEEFDRLMDLKKDGIALIDRELKKKLNRMNELTDAMLVINEGM